MPMSKDQLRRFPLFSTLTEAELEDICRGCEPLAFRAGEYLIRQGDEPDGAFLLTGGKVDVVTALPGGGESHLATMMAGSLIGETAFLDDSLRTASVRAAEEATTVFLGQRFLQGSLAQGNASGFKVFRAILDLVAERIENMVASIDELIGGGTEERHPEAAPVFESPVARQCSFDYRAYLPRLPCFRFFRSKEIEAFAARTQAVELEAGEVLFHRHGAAASAFVVVRGAVELGLLRGGTRHQLAILGPGRICGASALILDRPHAMRCQVREGATLLVLGRAAFDELLSVSSSLAGPFIYALGQSLLLIFSSMTRTLSRLTSLKRIAEWTSGRGVDEAG